MWDEWTARSAVQSDDPEKGAQTFLNMILSFAMIRIIRSFNQSVMYTVFKTGGKQYRAIKGGVEHIELCPFQEGKPLVMNAVTFSSEGISKSKVHLDILEEFKEDKIIIFKKKRRHNYRRTKGHRQRKLKVMVSDIVNGNAGNIAG